MLGSRITAGRGAANLKEVGFFWFKIVPSKQRFIPSKLLPHHPSSLHPRRCLGRGRLSEGGGEVRSGCSFPLAPADFLWHQDPSLLVSEHQPPCSVQLLWKVNAAGPSQADGHAGRAQPTPVRLLTLWVKFHPDPSMNQTPQQPYEEPHSNATPGPWANSQLPCHHSNRKRGKNKMQRSMQAFHVAHWLPQSILTSQ